LDHHRGLELLFPVNMPPLHNIDSPPELYGRNWSARLASQFLLLLLALLSPAARAAQTGTQHEYELKAGVLFHIIQYVDWPSESVSNSPAAIQIGLVGDIPFVEALEVLNGKTIQKRKLVVKRISTPQEAVDCQVLFIGASEKARLPDIVTELNNRPILTVGEVEGFAEHGGMVNLVSGQNRIVMEINREVASRAGLTFSSQVLKLAKVVSN
jgi:hypothetical protein